MGTLSKALGASGGFICGSKTLIELLVNKARSFIYSTALPPSCAAAASAALEIVRTAEGDTLRSRLWNNVRLLAKCLTPISPADSGADQSDLSGGDWRRATEPAFGRNPSYATVFSLRRSAIRRLPAVRLDFGLRSPLRTAWSRYNRSQKP